MKRNYMIIIICSKNGFWNKSPTTEATKKSSCELIQLPRDE